MTVRVVLYVMAVGALSAAAQLFLDGSLHRLVWG